MFGSVEPSPAALVRAAFDLFESCFILQKYLREADASLKYLSMGYKKDIFGSFVYDFELLHNRSFLVK